MLEQDAQASPRARAFADAQADATHARTHALTQKDLRNAETSPFVTHAGGLKESLSALGFEEQRRAPITRRGEREPISPLLRQLVYRRDNWTCQLCGARPYAADARRRSGALHLDHIVPWSAHGPDRSDNLRTLCGPCNQDRSNFVSDSDRAAMPIVGICVPCMAATGRLDLGDYTRPQVALDAYCGSRHHVSWVIPGWHIL